MKGAYLSAGLYLVGGIISIFKAQNNALYLNTRLKKFHSAIDANKVDGIILKSKTMKTIHLIFRIVSFFLLFITISDAQTIGTNTIIQVFNMAPQINSNQDTTTQVVLPDTSFKYEKILLHYSLNMPPAGWDPWDRIAYVRVFTSTDTFEIARIITPYSKSCTWTVDVTDYRSILTGTVNINSFILFWSSGNKGYLVSISLEFIGGNPYKEAYKIKNLWGNDVFHRWEYGNVLDPIYNHLPPKTILIDTDADSVKIKVTTTGHGQGNTYNAAEFYNTVHSLQIDSFTTISHNLWRSDCASNPCSPQSGTWQYNRAGWCPGSEVRSWDVDITPYVVPNNNVTLKYIPQAYTNSCSPSYSGCVSGVTCPDCNYNSTGHTMPWYLVQSQIVFYKNLSISTPIKEIQKLPSDILLYPNPNNGLFSIEFSSFNKQSDYTISITDAIGQILFEKQIRQKKVEIDISNYNKGIYFLKINSGNEQIFTKLLYQ